MRSRAKRSASRPAAHDSATYGSMRAAPATPSTHPSPVCSQTSSTSSGQGSDMPTAASAWLAIVRRVVPLI